MSKCNFCKKDMQKVDNCSCGEKNGVTFPDKKTMKASTYHFDEPDGRCHDCNIKHGKFHHPGCDVERCPKCNGQLISCGCLSLVYCKKADNPAIGKSKVIKKYAKKHDIKVKSEKQKTNL